MSNAEKTPTVERSALVGQDIRSLIVHVEGSSDALPRVKFAADLARKLNATLVGVGVEMFQIYSDPYGALGGEWVVQLEEIVRDDLKRAEATFRSQTTGLRTEWFAIEALPAQAMARLSRNADLIIAGGAPLVGRDAYRAASTADLVMQSGRPVLVAPPAPQPFRGDAVVVAWKDTRESRRAVADAMPFLKAAEEVVVLEVCEKGEIEDAALNTAEVVKHLRGHGVVARGKTVVALPGFEATEIQNEARVIGADLIVAGAYGHSRLGEWAFGGVTYELLHAPERYVLLSH